VRCIRDTGKLRAEPILDQLPAHHRIDPAQQRSSDLLAVHVVARAVTKAGNEADWRYAACI
jgi:hypothetical protein